MWHTADNLHARLAAEMCAHADLLALMEAARASGQLTFNMTPTQQRMLTRLHRVHNALRLSLLELDDTLAVFTEYCGD
jgi:hypothetical protein